ncbi:MAG: elongation factor EF-2 [Thermoplasmata archaeon]|jgi:elongation factor 2|nr:elongation factor EF-2 [Thermoplasmata archaeon]
MGRKEDNIRKAQALMRKPELIRNIGTAAHIDHGKTTLSDNLIAGSGMMSEDLAGKQLLLDFDEQEQARGITINAASASMVYKYKEKEFLINLIDTPGHVDFGGDVTRAMRAIDGVIILCCAVEGVMPQTETVIRQAIKERVRPILFVNKVDRLINELQVTPEQMQQRLSAIMNEVDLKVQNLLPPELKEKWKLNVAEGTIVLGSAFNNWAITVPYMKKTGITFKDIYEYCKNGDQKTLAKRAPLHEVLLEMVITHLPNPLEAQKLRIPTIWHGDLESPLGKGMMTCNPEGPVAFMVTKIIVDPHAGEVAVGRLFSGKVSKGAELHIIGMPNPNRAQLVSLTVGADRIPVEEIDAGNVVAVSGLKDAIAGSTVSSDPEMQPFEKMVHYSEPVVTVAIEAKHTKDLPKLVDVLRTVAKADPSIQVEINQETGEHLMSGMGELHLEITTYRIVNEHKVEIKTSQPIVVFRECVGGRGGPFEGKSPNKHNRFYIEVEPLQPAVVNAIRAGEIETEGRIKDAKALMKKLQELGMSKEEAKGVVAFNKTNVLIDMTKGIQYLHETMELVKEAFDEAMVRGPLANEKCMAMKVMVVDAKLHEDSVHRGPAQVIPAARSAVYGSMCQAGRVLYEPIQKLFINVPDDMMGNAIREVQQRRGIIEDMKQESEHTTVQAKVPVAEMFGFAASIRGATSGRALWSTENAGFETMPREVQEKTVPGVRQRKGLKPEPYDASYYSG